VFLSFVKLERALCDRTQVYSVNRLALWKRLLVDVGDPTGCVGVCALAAERVHLLVK
jgi:hypothetical protein